MTKDFVRQVDSQRKARLQAVKRIHVDLRPLDPNTAKTLAALTVLRMVT